MIHAIAIKLLAAGIVAAFPVAGTVPSTATGSTSSPILSQDQPHHSLLPEVKRSAPIKPKAESPKPKAEKPKPKPKAAEPVKKRYATRMYDSVEPWHIPNGERVATYINGPYAVAHVSKDHGKVIWIDVSGDRPDANVLDVEPTDATPDMAGPWAKECLKHHHLAIIYTMKSWWPDVKKSVAKLPPKLQDRVRYWIADPTGKPHIVKGSSATQWGWFKNVDISKVKPGLLEALN